MKHQFAGVVCGSAYLLALSGALFAQPAPRGVQPSNPAAQKDDPSEGSTDVDRTVAYPVAQVLVAARQALATYRCDNRKKERTDYVECVIDGRNEKVTVQFSAAGSETRVQIKTWKYWYRLFDEKNWSTPIFDAMMIALEGPPDPARGARVRLTTPGAARQRLTGNILTVGEKTLTIIDQGGQRVKIPRELVTRVDVSVSRKRHAVHGFLIGAAVGGLLGAMPTDCSGVVCVPPTVASPLLAVTCGAYGAVIGRFVRSDKWAEMPLDGIRVGLRPGPSAQGGSLTLTFAF